MRQSYSTALQQATNAVPAIVPFGFNYISKLQNFQKKMKDIFGKEVVEGFGEGDVRGEDGGWN